MDRYESLKNKFIHREKILGTTMTLLNEPILIDKMNRSDLDFILFDGEHGRFDSQNLIPLLHMCRTLNLPSFVRVQDSEYHLIAKTIDMGADGIMLPRTETLEQLQVAVDAIYFSPVGRKGAGGYAQFRKGESFEQFQSGRYLIPQVESPRGIDILPQILEKFGDKISGIIVGPYDLSVMLGTPMNIYSPVMHAAIQKVIDICTMYGKSAGIFCNDPHDAADYYSMGANILWTAIDMQFFLAGFNQTIDALNKIPSRV